MFKLSVAIAAGVMAYGAVPASAVTFNLGGATLETTGSLTYTAMGSTLTVNGATYIVAPTALTLGGLTAGGKLRRTTGGIGMRSSTEGSSEWDQIDTNPTGSGAAANLNEILQIDMTGPLARLVSATFNWVDADDTLRVYGRTGNTLTYLGFPGEFWDNTATDAPISGGATVTGHTGTGGISNAWNFSVSFAPTLGAYDSFYFTSQRNSSDGYRLQSVTLAAVPEAATWAMMVGGFGMMGFMLRRRREAPVFG